MLNVNETIYHAATTGLYEGSVSDSLIQKLVDKRYTVRSFHTGKKVSEEDTQSIINMAQRAPSKQNKFPYRIRIIDNQQNGANSYRKNLIKHTSCSLKSPDSNLTLFQNEVITAPLSLLVTLNPVINLQEDKEANLVSTTLTATRDAMIAVTFMLLRGLELDLDTACVGCFSYALQNIDEFREDFHLIDNEYPCIVLNFGYAIPINPEGKSPDHIVRYRNAQNQGIASPGLAYINPEDHQQGVRAIFNRGPQIKQHPEGFITYLRK